MSMADSSGAGTVIGASIAAVIAFLGLVVSKEQKTSEFRQAWIDALRNDLAIYLSRINSAYDAAVAGFESTAELWKNVREDVVSMTDASTRIRLRLNHKEERERYSNSILWSSTLNVILVSWGVTEKKMCCGGEVLYRSK